MSKIMLLSKGVLCLLVAAVMSPLAFAYERVLVESIPSNLDDETVAAAVRQSLEYRGWAIQTSAGGGITAMLSRGKDAFLITVRVDGRRVVATVKDPDGGEPADLRRAEWYSSFVREDVGNSLRAVSLAVDAMSRRPAR